MKYPCSLRDAVLLSLAVIAFPSLVVAQSQTAPAVPPSQALSSTDVRGNNTFALNLHRQLAVIESGGSVASPWSLRVALAMVFAGAAGDTAAEIHGALALEGGADEVHATFNREAGRLMSKDELALANALWVQSGFDILQAFEQTLATQYHAEPSLVDFSTPETARAKINGWIEGATGGRVGELIAEGVLDRRTRLVLTNAIHFQGDWELAFVTDETLTQPFFVAPGRNTEAKLMHHQGTHGYVEEEDLQLLELAYAETDLAMYVILPKGARSLGEIEQDLSAQRLARLLGRLAPAPVTVHLPRFEMANRIRADSILKAMGMQLAFDPNRADFSPIDGRRVLYLEAVLHGAFIDVNERGTEAGAGSAAVINTRALRVPVQFRADRPFLFFVAERSTGMILFIGRLTDPSRLAG